MSYGIYAWYESTEKIVSTQLGPLQDQYVIAASSLVRICDNNGTLIIHFEAIIYVQQCLSTDVKFGMAKYILCFSKFIRLTGRFWNSVNHFDNQ